MLDAISIFAFISTIFFSLSQSYIVYIIKRNNKEGLKATSSFSIISCLIYQLIWFIYYKKIENNNVCWCYFVGIIFSFIWAAIYLYFLSKDLNKKQNMYMCLYLFMLMDLVFEIWFIERDILSFKEKITSKRNIVRIIACVFNISMYTTFGFNIFKFFKELDVSYIILPISIIGLFNSFIWLLYGIVSKDENNKKFYLYTNIFGISFCVIQIILFFYFKDRKKETKPDVEKLLTDTESNKSKKKKKKKSDKKAIDEENDILAII